MRKINWLWIYSAVIKGQFFYVIVLTGILTSYFYKWINQQLTLLLNPEPHPLYTYNYSIGYQGLLLIPIAFVLSVVSIGLLQKLLNTTRRSRKAKAYSTISWTSSFVLPYRAILFSLKILRWIFKALIWALIILIASVPTISRPSNAVYVKVRHRY